MRLWRICAVAVVAGGVTVAQAQDSFPVVDWGPTMQTEAMNSAMDYAARSGGSSGATQKPGARSGPHTAADVARAKANCRTIRAAAARGESHPRLGWALGKCKESGW